MSSSKVKKPVSLQQMNSWRMHRQFLDHPFPSKDIVDLITAIGWVYSPGCSTPYLACWARMPSFKVDDLNRPVFDERRLVQLETLRGYVKFRRVVHRSHLRFAQERLRSSVSRPANKCRSLNPIWSGSAGGAQRSPQRSERPSTSVRGSVATVKDFGPSSAHWSNE
jgi:hypothetical protein